MLLAFTISTAEGVFVIVGSLISAALWALGKQAKKTARDKDIDKRFSDVETKDKQQDEHLENTDTMLNKTNEDLEMLDQKVNRVMGLKQTVMQLIRENKERKQENERVEGKLDTLGESMHRIELLLAKK